MKTRINDIKYTLLVDRIVRDTGNEIIIAGWRPNTNSVDRAEIRLPKSQIVIRQDAATLPVAIDVPRWILVDRKICPTNRALSQPADFWRVQYDQQPPLRLRRDELLAAAANSRHIDQIEGDLAGAYETHQEIQRELTAEFGHEYARKAAWAHLGHHITRLKEELARAEAPGRAEYRQQRHERRMARAEGRGRS